MSDPSNFHRCRVLLVEDDALFAQELALLLSQTDDFVVVAHAPDLASAETYLRQPHELAIIDLGLPDGDGVDLVRAHRQVVPQAKCLVMTVFEDQHTVHATLQAGADGYLVKTARNFVEQLRQVMDGLHPIDARVAGHLLEGVRESRIQPPAVDLSPRELQTLEALAHGLSYNDIATALNVSPKTVPDYPGRVSWPWNRDRLTSQVIIPCNN